MPRCCHRRALQIRSHWKESELLFAEAAACLLTTPTARLGYNTRVDIWPHSEASLIEQRAAACNCGVCHSADRRTTACAGRDEIPRAG